MSRSKITNLLKSTDTEEDFYVGEGFDIEEEPTQKTPKYLENYRTNLNVISESEDAEISESQSEVFEMDLEEGKNAKPNPESKPAVIESDYLGSRFGISEGDLADENSVSTKKSSTNSVTPKTAATPLVTSAFDVNKGQSRF